MATFEYKAYDKEGNPKTGVVEASDQETAASLLRDLELTVTSLEIRVKRGFEIKDAFYLYSNRPTY